MDVSRFSARYAVRPLTEDDIPRVLEVCRQNPLYFQHCPPAATAESIRRDMQALPPRKTLNDKYYVGYFEGDRLIAVMDYIHACPSPQTAFIGFFMLRLLL